MLQVDDDQDLINDEQQICRQRSDIFIIGSHDCERYWAITCTTLLDMQVYSGRKLKWRLCGWLSPHTLRRASSLDANRQPEGVAEQRYRGRFIHQDYCDWRWWLHLWLLYLQ